MHYTYIIITIYRIKDDNGIVYRFNNQKFHNKIMQHTHRKTKNRMKKKYMSIIII